MLELVILVLKKSLFLVFNEIVVNVDYLVLEKVNLVVKQSNLVAGKIVAKQFIIVLDSVYLVVKKIYSL